MDARGVLGTLRKHCTIRRCWPWAPVYFVGLLLVLALSGCGALPQVRLPAALAAQDPAGVCPAPVAVSAAAALPGATARDQGVRPGAAWPARYRFELTEAAADGLPLSGGNQVTLLENGAQTYAAMRRAIAQARDHIDLETYAFDPEGFGEEMAALLLKKRATGVRVHIIYDSIGSMHTPPAFFDRLRAGGIDLVEYNPFHFARTGLTWQTNNRDHRRILAIDGQVAFTGGLNISDVYDHPPAGGQSLAARLDYRQRFWRDTDIMLRGPAVAQFEALFLRTWQRETGTRLADSRFFPPLRPQGRELVHVLADAPARSVTSVYRAYLGAIKAARRRIYITQAYFVPDPQLIHALEDAAACGVDVRIILPESSGPNIAMIAGRAYYEPLLKAGVKMYEYQKGVLHAKMAVIDGIWATVGSTNLDYRSFLLNDELNLDVLDPAFAAQMEAAFRRDQVDSRPVQLVQWQSRSLFERLKEQAVNTIKYLL
jgi:cardiolipin synthase A/B